MIFGISGYRSNNCHAIFCGAKGLGSCGNVPVKNKANRFLFLKGNYIYHSILFQRLGVALLSSPKKCYSKSWCLSKIMASCSRSSLRFARPKESRKAGENQGDNREMNRNGCNCRRLTFVSDFDCKPNRVNDIVFRVQGPPENNAR